MWDYDTDYRNAYHVEETPHGIFRARVTLDEYPDAPEHDFGCPVYGYEFRGYSADVDETPRYGHESDIHSGIDFHAALMHFYNHADRFSEALETTDRWLRVFHGGGLREISSTVWQGDPYYLTYDTRAMREFWGQTGEMLETSDPEATEWQSYIDGDVYGIDVERATSFDDDGEPDGWESLDQSCWGFYGEEYAKEAALEALKYEIEHTAAGMLPLAV